MFCLQSNQKSWKLQDNRDTGEERRKTKHTKIESWLTGKGGEKQFVEEGLPQVLKRQMEKQLNQVQGNRLVISFSLKIFIKNPTKARQTK